MRDKKIFVYLFMVFIFALALFMLFRTNTQSFRRLNASVSPEEEKNIIIENAKRYIEDNIDKFDGESEIVLKDLITNNYLTKDETEEVTKDLYDEDTRIFFTVKDYEVFDIYLKDELFSKLFACSDMCYINDSDNYIYYTNDLYRILKVDSSGSVYIVSNETKKINTTNIEQIIKNKYNELDRKISNSVDFVSLNDINNSKFLKIEDDMLISSATGYKMYNVNLNETRDVDVPEADSMFVIKLLNTVNYKLGNGTKFNPYVVSE